MNTEGLLQLGPLGYCSSFISSYFLVRLQIVNVTVREEGGAPRVSLRMGINHQVSLIWCNADHTDHNPPTVWYSVCKVCSGCVPCSSFWCCPGIISKCMCVHALVVQTHTRARAHARKCVRATLSYAPRMSMQYVRMHRPCVHTDSLSICANIL